MNKRIEVPDITIQSRMYIFNPTPYEIEYGSEIESIYVVEGSFDGFLELNPDAPLKTFNPDAIMAKLPEYVEFITEAANSVSNPELVSVLYNAGLCESDEYVTQGELRMLVNRQFGDIFKNDTLLESFDEFKYCTNITKLPDGAFSGCSNLGSITLPESIYKLGNGIFNDCPMLDSIKIDSNNATYADYGCNAIFDIQSKSLIEGCSSSEIPEDCDTIAENAFAGTGIEEAIIPDNIKSIKENAFENCEDLETLSIGSNVEDITTGSFAGCSSLSTISVNEDNPTYDSRDDSNAVIETATDSIVVGCVNTTIPDTVLRIAPKAFKGQSTMVTFTLPEQIESVGSEAFSDCTSLETFTVESETPSELGADAFENVDSSFKIMVPENTADIYKEAPGWSEYADVIEEPSAPTAEYDIIVSVNARNTTFATKLLHSDDLVDILPYIKFQEIDGVKQTTPVLSYQFSTIGAHTVKYKLFDSTQVPAQMFNGVSLTGTVELSPEITTINEGAFMETNLSSINLDNITSIRDFAFYQCINYRNIILSSSLTSIGESAFYNSTLVKIYAPTPPTIGTTVFGSAVAKILVLPGKKAVYDVASGWSDYSSKIEEMASMDAIYDITSTSSATNILTTDDTFNPQSNIDVIVIDDGTTYINPTIRSYTFNTLGDHKVSFVMKDNTKIPQYMFSNVTALKSLDIPNTVTTVEYRSLRGTPNYKHPVFPDSVTSIGIEVIVNAGLESIQFPNNANFTTISQGQFSDCTSLPELIFPDSITSFGDYTVQRCTSLRKIVIPAGVSNLNNYSSFVDLTALETLVIKRTTPPTCTNSQFTNIPATCKLYVPDESVSTYEAHSYWGVKFANKIYPMSDLEPSTGATVEMTVKSTSGSSATQLMYAGMSSYVSKLEIDGVEESTVVESKVLSPGLHRIKYTLTDNTTIPENMFRGIKAFTDPNNMLFIADTVTTIGTSAFRSCINLSQILIPDSVTSIGSYAFYECPIVYPVFGSGITSLGEDIFSSVELSYITMKSPVPSTLPEDFQQVYDLYVMPEYLSDYENSVFATDYGIDNILPMDPDIQLTIDPTIGRGSDNMVTIMNEGMSEYVRLMELNNTRVQPADELEITGSNPVTIKIYLKDDRYIPDGMFAGLTNITACTTASMRLMIIGESAFEGCSNLTQLNNFYVWIGDGVVLIIGDNAFRQTGLQAVVTPVNTTKIGASAFAGCTDLTEVRLAANDDNVDGMCESIGNSAFNGCTSLTEVYVYQSGTSALGTNVFSNNAVDRIIYVPVGWLEDYQNDWSDYSSVLQEFDFEPV